MEKIKIAVIEDNYSLGKNIMEILQIFKFNFIEVVRRPKSLSIIIYQTYYLQIFIFLMVIV
jgi:hypothetical protein